MVHKANGKVLLRPKSHSHAEWRTAVPAPIAGDRDIVQARLVPELMSKPMFPSITYSASIAKRGRGLVITYLDSADCVGDDECRALAGFVSTQKALPQYSPPSRLASVLEEAALLEKRSVRQLLDHESRLILGKHLGDAQTAQLQFAWQEYMAFQESVFGIMAQGFDQARAEQMVICLPANACFLIASPPMALSFLRADDNSAMDHPGFEAQPVLSEKSLGTSEASVRVRQQGALPIQQCVRKLSEIEARIDSEDVQRIAVICDL